MAGEKHYKYINIAYLEELTGGDAEFMHQIVETYLDAIPENVQQLISAVNTNNAAHITFFSHKLKGSFYFIGSEAIGKTFAEIEALSKDTANYYQVPAKFWSALKDVNLATEELKSLAKGGDD